METNEQKYIHHSVKGMNKKENQDNFLIIEEKSYNLYAIFDGVGSASNSKQGTEIAKKYIEKYYKEFINNEKVMIDKLMFSCNNYFAEVGIKDAFTTYCVVVLSKQDSNKMFYSTMGDTRIYLITKQYIEQITEDDRYGSYENLITKCLGIDYLMQEDFVQYYAERKSGNLLMCTDGFYSFLEENKMSFFEVFNRKMLKSIKESLTKYIDNKNFDDSTYVFIR